MEKVAPDVYRLGAGPGVSAFLVLAEAPVLVDTGLSGWGPSVRRQIARLGIRPDWIVLTHGDPDHIGNVGFLREAMGAQVCAAAGERPSLTHRLWPATPLLRRAVFWALTGPRRPPVVDRWLGPRETVAGLEVVATPGHTPGHIALRWGSTLIAGDAFVSGARPRESPRLLTMDRALSRRSIEGLAGLEVDLAVSAHGEPMRDASRKLRELVASWR